MIEKQPLAEALRAEILKLATEGDLTADILLRIMRVAKTGRDLLVSLMASPSNLAGMIRRPNNPFAIPVLGDNMQDEGLGLSDTQMGSMLPLPYSSAMPSENFGMTAIREIIAATKSMNGSTSPAKLVEALVLARENGLADVAKELEAQLGLGKNGKNGKEKQALEMAPDSKEKEPVA